MPVVQKTETGGEPKGRRNVRLHGGGGSKFKASKGYRIRNYLFYGRREQCKWTQGEDFQLHKQWGFLKHRVINVSLLLDNFYCKAIYKASDRDKHYTHLSALALMLVALIRVIITVMKHWLEASCREKSLFALYFHFIVYHWRNLGQEVKLDSKLEAGADAEVSEYFCLLASSACFFKQPRTSRLGWPHPNSLSPPVISH